METVQAIPKDEIPTVTRLLLKHYGRDFADIWELGINVALRISDLLALRLAEVVGRETLALTERKTGKRREVVLNAKARAIIARRAAAYPSDIWLFQSHGNRGKAAQKPLNRSTVARVFADIGQMIGRDLGTHSMRKTRGAAMYQAGVPIETICKTLNHSSPAVTMRYIGIDAATVAKTYDDFVL